jgi:hypothetical protein
VALILLALGLASMASAATIVPLAGSITAQMVVDSSTMTVLAFDVRALALLDVGNPTSIGTVFLNDEGAASPNNVLMAYNSSLTEAGFLTLHSAAGVIVGSDFLVPATGTPIGTVTNLALLEALKPLIFDFGIVSGTAIGETAILFDMQLNQIFQTEAPVPEPATAVMVISSIGVLAFLRRRHLSR